MKNCSLALVCALLGASITLAHATQADDTTIAVTAQTAGVTPFLSQLTLTASDTTTIETIQFSIAPKPGSITHPLSGTFSRDYLVAHSEINEATGEIFITVYGLYDSYANSVTLTYGFMDGSSKQESVAITTAAFADPCGYSKPTYLQHRDNSVTLSYDYILTKGGCSDLSPVVIDTDGALRWQVPTAANFSSFSGGFFDNAVYYGHGPQLYRIDLDGTFSLVADYTSAGVNNFHHNFDRGKTGIIVEVDTPDQVESVLMEVSYTGEILKTWNMAEIISAAMLAGGDDPTQFVYPSPTDWFHNNAATYNRADDTLIVSSRENFLIAIDYETSEIKWILGDPTKHWNQFPSLQDFALTLPAGSLPPIGQHAVSVTFDQGILVFDNGFNSFFQTPPGLNRVYSSPRKYALDLEARTATEVWNFEMNQSILSPICGSVYEDAPYNYLIDYAFVGGFDADTNYAQLLGLDAGGNTIFYYQYPTIFCNEAFNSVPLHLESSVFPSFGPKAINISTRALVSSGENALIAGFIVTGTEDKKVILRALGPSLGDAEVSGSLADPVLTIFDASGTMIASNDDWQTDPGASEVSSDGLAPSSETEAATIQTLAPGAYTAVVTGKSETAGIALVEAYDLSPASASRLANVSGRGSVETGDNVLISGFIVGDVASATVVIRALGPSLAPSVGNALGDPAVTIYDTNGVAIASNDNWQDDPQAEDVAQNGLAPSNDAEAAIVLRLPAGAYTAIVRGIGGSTGIGLVEAFDLN